MMQNGYHSRTNKLSHFFVHSSDPFYMPVHCISVIISAIDSSDQFRVAIRVGDCEGRVVGRSCERYHWVREPILSVRGSSDVCVEG
jgi:hypothetical protein